MIPAGVQGIRPTRPLDQIAHADRMESVNVFGRVDGFQHQLGINLRRQRKLDQNAVNFVTIVQVVDQSEQTLGGGVGGPLDLFAVDPQRLARLHLAADVNLRLGVCSHQNGGEARRDARGF